MHPLQSDAARTLALKAFGQGIRGVDGILRADAGRTGHHTTSAGGPGHAVAVSGSLEDAQGVRVRRRHRGYLRRDATRPAVRMLPFESCDGARPGCIICLPCYVGFMPNASLPLKPLESEAQDAVRALLESLPGAEVRSVEPVSVPGLNTPPVAAVHLTHGGKVRIIVIEALSDGAPRFVRSCAYRLETSIRRLHAAMRTQGVDGLNGIMVSPYFSPASRAICLEHGIGHLDFVGNTHLAFGSVYVERSVVHRPKPETRRLRSLFSPKVGAILRVLLQDPDRTWRVGALASASGASRGHVSNVRRALLDREWIRKQAGGVALAQPGALLRAWRDAYRGPRGQRVTGYTHLHGAELKERLQGVLNTQADQPRCILSQNSAAQWLAPYLRDVTVSFYADAVGAERLRADLELVPADVGVNVFIRVPTDESLFHDAVEPAPGVFCTGPVVTYLDLWIGNDRKREAAEHLAQSLLPWLAERPRKERAL